MTSLPLGIDIGRTRVRVALTVRRRGGLPALLAVAARDHAGEPVAALRSALEELPTRERRCVLALGPPDALLRSAEFPPMTPWERIAAARFEAARFIDYPIADADVALARTAGGGRWAIGVVRHSAVQNVLAAAQHAGLQPIGIDDAALALGRAHPDAHGIIDLGADATRLALFGQDLPYVVRLPIGGERLTDAIAQSLGVDVAAAEERKRRIGFGGAGDASREALFAALSQAFADARACGYTDVRTVVLCGNGSRVPGLSAAIERATGYAVVPATLPPECSDRLPPDVLRAAAPDWSLAYGLSLWSIAA